MAPAYKSHCSMSPKESQGYSVWNMKQGMTYLRDECLLCTYAILCNKLNDHYWVKPLDTIQLE